MINALMHLCLQNSQAGVSILMVRATDGDGDTVTYSIASGVQCHCL